MLAFVAYTGGSVIAHARALEIDRIVVHGNRRLSSGEVMAVLEGLRGQNLIRTNLEGWRHRLLASPWIKDAALRRSLPSTVEVLVSERSPIALGRIDGKLYLIDERGLSSISTARRYADVDLPIVDGLAAQPGSEQPADEARGELVARLLGALASKPELLTRISQIDVTDLHNVAVIFSGDPALVYVGDDRFLPRLESYEELATALRDRVPDIDYVDLRFDDRIYVRPASAPKGAAAKKIASRG